MHASQTRNTERVKKAQKKDPKSSSKNTDEPQRQLLSGPRNVSSSKKERHIRLGPSLAYKGHTNNFNSKIVLVLAYRNKILIVFLDFCCASYS